MKVLFLPVCILALALAGCDASDPNDDFSAVGLDLGTSFTYRWTFTEPIRTAPRRSSPGRRWS